ncbi:hypothetical protein AGOR_G00067480 [Albula goreensis]|uniref:ITPR-interacting domain-containing protein n=1 Tax=Albula goreensis TaxID=1534307 RepID=A0A8T3DX45_9TELE|nr:hypothetical protein AGOR_G00067480 [Albula goreensis]
MDSPSSTDRRQAWVRSSRHWLTLEDAEPHEPHGPSPISDTLPDDEVFFEGCSAGKIESWLQGCGPELGQEDPGHLTIESLLKAGSSFEDDLSLGAEGGLKASVTRSVSQHCVLMPSAMWPCLLRFLTSLSGMPLHVYRRPHLSTAAFGPTLPLSPQPHTHSPTTNNEPFVSENAPVSSLSGTLVRFIHSPLSFLPLMRLIIHKAKWRAATVLNVGEDGQDAGRCPLLLPPPRPRQKGPAASAPQRLGLPFACLGHSMASSGLSSATSKTASSVSEVLQMCSEDAEETLYQLGFGCDEPQVTARIPARFFSFPSQLRGINFRLFLESQLCRLREEDPGLSLASRFRQVEVLTAMANAFYSLYSHVSRTPLQKLAPPELSFSMSPVESKIGQRFFSSVRSEPKSPVERFKDTVSKMCLYTGSSSRCSDSASPHASPHKRSSLPDLVGMVIGNVKLEGTRDQDSGHEDKRNTEDMMERRDGEEQRESERGGVGNRGGERGELVEKDSQRNVENSIDLSDMKSEKQKEKVVELCEMDSERQGEKTIDLSDMESERQEEKVVELTEMDSERQGEKTIDLSDMESERQGEKVVELSEMDNERQGERVVETGLNKTQSQMESLMGRTEAVRDAARRLRFSEPEPQPCASRRLNAASLIPKVKPAAGIAPIAKVTHDVICPQIIESVHQAPFTQPHQTPFLEEGCRPDQRTVPSVGQDTLPATRDTGLETNERVSKETRDERCFEDVCSDKTRPLASTPISYGSRSEERPPCQITVTGWEGDGAALYVGKPEKKGVAHSSAKAAVTQVSPTSNSGKNRNYLSPVRPPSLGRDLHSNQQANSFELEEVHSAGEDEMGQSEGQILMVSPGLSAVKRQREVFLRGDSLHSDSSGYAEEECNPRSSSPEKEGS